MPGNAIPWESSELQKFHGCFHKFGGPLTQVQVPLMGFQVPFGLIQTRFRVHIIMGAIGYTAVSEVWGVPFWGPYVRDPLLFWVHIASPLFSETPKWYQLR